MNPILDLLIAERKKTQEIVKQNRNDLGRRNQLTGELRRQTNEKVRGLLTPDEFKRFSAWRSGKRTKK